MQSDSSLCPCTLMHLEVASISLLITHCRCHLPNRQPVQFLRKFGTGTLCCCSWITYCGGSTLILSECWSLSSFKQSAHWYWQKSIADYTCSVCSLLYNPDIPLHSVSVLPYAGTDSVSLHHHTLIWLHRRGL